jgi:hypothetical protein
MTAQQLKANALNNTLGAALLLFGALLSCARLATATEHVSGMWNLYGAEALGMLPATGLAAARLLQSLTLDPTGAASVALQFLLSCWPVAAIFLGAILLRRNFAQALKMPSEPAGDARENGSGLRGERS